MKRPDDEQQIGQSTANSGTTTEKDHPFSPDKAMRRLAYLAGCGCLIVLLFGAQAWPQMVSIVSVGLMTACAAALAAALLGFLFGVPYTREFVSAPQLRNHDDDIRDVEQSRQESDARASLYRPNTSLEQISDWLTKMLVGLGLVEMKVIPEKLQTVAKYVSTGLGSSTQAEPFAFAILIFFSVCGFLFGFLWARIYLRRWYIKADEELAKKLDDKILKASKIELDATALALTGQALNGDPDEAPVNEAKLAEAIKRASTHTRAVIFEQARVTSLERNVYDYDVKNLGVIAVLKALIACDTKSLYHRNHGELSYSLSRKKPPDIPEALIAIDEAIRRRDLHRIKGWKYYEFRRSQYRIQLDDNYEHDRPSERATADLILTDLKFASSEREKWPGWIANHEDVAKWIRLNNAETVLTRP